MNKIKRIIFFVLFGIFSCSDEINENIETSPCLDNMCYANFSIDPLVSPGVYEDSNGYWHISHQGYNYFTELVASMPWEQNHLHLQH